MKEAVALWLVYALTACALSLGLGVMRRIHWAVPALWFLALGLGWATFAPLLSESPESMSFSTAVFFLIAVIAAIIVTTRSQ